ESYRRFDGALDELRVWDGARSQADIQAEMLRGAPSNTAGLLMRLPFDNLAGGATRETVSNASVPVIWSLAGLAGVVEGRIGTPGEQRVYTFTLAQDTMLAFDSLQDNSQLNVRIDGPGGLSVTRNMRNGDSDEFGGANPLFRAPAGQYTITVDANGANTGSFAFRLLDLAGATPISTDSVVSGTISGSGENRAFKFDVAAGESLFLDAQSISAQQARATFRLIDPLGRQVFGPTDFVDRELGRMAVGGTYTLLVEGRVWRNWPVDYRFAVQTVADQPAIPITLGGTNPAQPTVVPGQTGNALALRGVDFVEVPDGPATSPARNMTLEGWFKLDRFANTWTSLAVKGADRTATAAYLLSVRSNGQLVAAVGDNAGEQSVSTDAGVFITGEWVHVAMVADRDGGTLKLYVNGVEQVSGTIRNSANADVADALQIGRYQELAGDYGAYEGAVDSFRLWDVARGAAQITAGMATPPPAGTAGLLLALDFQNTNLSGGAQLRNLNPQGVSGRIEQPGETQTYRFSLAERTYALFDSLTNNSGLVWSLTGPEGTQVANRRFDQSDSRDFGANPALRLEPGDYELMVDGTGDATGYFNFRLLDLAAAQPLPLGTEVSGSLSPSSSTVAYRFAAAAGERVVFDAITATPDMGLRIIDPFGTDVPGVSFADLDNLELPRAGMYTLVIEGRVDHASNAAYAFRLTPISFQTTPYVIGQRVDA
ncbi:MAG: hypothetical protein B7X78_02875, partial [Sphingomonadales bacterium 39-62-4]